MATSPHLLGRIHKFIWQQFWVRFGFDKLFHAFLTATYGVSGLLCVPQNV